MDLRIGRKRVRCGSFAWWCCVAVGVAMLYMVMLYATLDEAIKSLGASRRVTILPDGTEIIPDRVNYSDDPFIPWNPNIRELWPGEY